MGKSRTKTKFTNRKKNWNDRNNKIIIIIVQEFPFVTDKAIEYKRQADVSKSICNQPDNGELFLAFQELSTLYYKEKNTNAGNTYKKVAQAIKDLTVVVTEKNALGLGKGKTKVNGIGKGSAEKMLEFVTTGTMAKLEEKRNL